MSVHNDVHLNIVCSNNDEAIKLADYLNENYDLDGDIQFQTSSFTIYTEEGACPNDNEVWIGYETGYREIGSENIYEFFEELEEIAETAGVVIENIRLFFISHECKGTFTFVKKLADTAFDNFIQCYIEALDEEDKGLANEIADNLREEYSSKIWMIVCGEEELSEYIENDEEGRTCEWEFEDEIRNWTDNIINEFKFPWDEGCTMWIATLDEDGEYLWENS